MDKQQADFEAWIKADSTLPLDRDKHGYEDMTTELMWHAWRAAQKANAPEGASGGESSANDRLGLACLDGTQKHDFALQPSSSIWLCTKCGAPQRKAHLMTANVAIKPRRQASA